MREVKGSASRPDDDRTQTAPRAAGTNSGNRQSPYGIESARILIVNDDPEACRTLASALSKIRTPKLRIHTAGTIEQALSILEEVAIDVCFSEFHLGPDVDATQLVNAARHQGHRVPFVGVTGYPDEDVLAREMLLAGFDDVILREDTGGANLYRIIRNSWLRNLRAKEIEEEAMIDPLTGLMNRRSLTQRLQVECERAERTGLPLSILFLDLNDFKPLNDQLGHLIGDLALKQVGRLLKENLRQSDGLGRYGGDEFIVVLPMCGKDLLCPLVEKLKAAVSSQPFTFGDLSVSLKIAIGSAQFDREQGVVSPEDLIANADRAMYADKRMEKSKP